MRYEKLGKTGLEVSAVTLGCMSFGEPGGRGRPWTLDEAACRDIVRQALDAGINFFDTAKQGTMIPTFPQVRAARVR